MADLLKTFQIDSEICPSEDASASATRRDAGPQLSGADYTSVNRLPRDTGYLQSNTQNNTAASNATNSDSVQQQTAGASAVSNKQVMHIHVMG